MSSSLTPDESTGRGHRQKRPSLKLRDIRHDDQEPPRKRSPSLPPSPSKSLRERKMSIFSEQTFLIYDWPYPKPETFTNLSPSELRWKEKIDSTGSDILAFDDGADDDWCDFAGNKNLYRGGAPALMSAIGRTFVNRAKIAFRSGATWAEFEGAERALDSEAAAKAEPDEERRALMQVEALNNAMRLAIFERLRVRLRREIWLEEEPQEEQVCDSGVDELKAKKSKSKPKSKSTAKSKDRCER